MIVTLAVLVSGTLTAAILDIRSGKIPNALPIALVFVAICIHALAGLPALALALSMMLIAFGLASVAFSVRWLGGGDVKLIAAASALVSYPGSIMLIIDILIAGAVLAIAQAAWHGRLWTFVRSASRVALSGIEPAEQTLLPYGVAIAGGSAVYALTTLVSSTRVSP